MTDTQRAAMEQEPMRARLEEGYARGRTHQFYVPLTRPERAIGEAFACAEELYLLLKRLLGEDGGRVPLTGGGCVVQGGGRDVEQVDWEKVREPSNPHPSPIKNIFLPYTPPQACHCVRPPHHRSPLTDDNARHPT